MSARRASCLGLAAALLLGGPQARGANTPSALDLPSNNIMPAPVDMTTARPAERPSEPTGNPLWTIPVSSLTVTRDRPIFVPSRRPPAAAVAGTPVVAPPPVAAPPAEPERPQLVLVGAIVSETEGFAVFLDQATNTVIRLRTGQDHLGWVLRSVKGREATLEKNRLTTTLELPAPDGSARTAPGFATPRPKGEPEL